MTPPPEAPATPPERPCPVCGGAAPEPHCFSAGAWRVGRCTGCGMIYLRNPPAQTALHDEHAWEHTRVTERSKRREGRRAYYFFSDGLKRLKHLLRGSTRPEIKLIRRHCPRGGSILDIGCADGGTLKALTDGDWKLYGIEPSPVIAATAHALCERHGGRVETATAAEGLPRFPSAQFDLVVMRSYLEHEALAADVLRETARILKPGGQVLIKVPNAACWSARLRGSRWPGVRHPDHVNYFTAPHLRRLLRDCGFAVCRFGFLSRLPTSDNLWALASPGPGG